MAVYKKPWYYNIYFEFSLNLPLLSVQTRLLKDAVERMTYDICRVRIKLYKWSWEFQLYKRPEMYGSNTYVTSDPDFRPPAPQRLSQRIARAFRNLGRRKNAPKSNHLEEK